VEGVELGEVASVRSSFFEVVVETAT